MPITHIPFGQPLLINDLSGSVPDNDWHLQENINDCRTYDNRVHLPFYVANNDFISLQLTALSTKNHAFFRINLIRDDTSAVLATFFPDIIYRYSTTSAQLVWYFLIPALPGGIDSLCCHLEITDNEGGPQIAIATSQQFKIYKNVPECSIKLTWSSLENMLDFVYVNDIISTILVLDPFGWSSPDWVISYSPTRLRLPYGVTEGVFLSPLNSPISGMTIGGVYILIVDWNFNDNVEFRFEIGGNVIGTHGSSVSAGPFQRVYQFLYVSGTQIDVFAKAHTAGAAFAFRTEITNIQILSLSDLKATTKQTMRLIALQWKPKYLEEDDIFKDSLGNREILYASSEPIYELLIDEVPEYIHNALRLAKKHDSFQIEGVSYFPTTKNHEPEWRNDSKFAQVRIDITKTNGQSTRSNC